MQCAQKHPMQDGQKFCGECGSKPEATLAKSVCSGCNSEGTGKFCGECGESMAKAVTADDVTAGLDELSDLFKSTSALKDELEAETGDDPDADRGFSLGEPSEEGFVDAAPMVDALMKGHNVLADRLHAVGREGRMARREIGVIAKAVGTVMGHLVSEVRSMSEQVAALGEARQPRRASVALLQKSVGLPPTGTEQDDSMRGDELCKAAVDAEVAGTLQGGDATLTQQYVNRGLTLKGICEADRHLGARLIAAVKKAA